MSLFIEAEPIPLTVDPDGVIRVLHTRVTLDTVVYAFADGATAEEIVGRYPALDLGDVYAVIGYILRHRDQVDAYLQKRQAQADAVRKENESKFPPLGIRERLAARSHSEK
jgi:uncharacterized protein (DUF433 family)